MSKKSLVRHLYTSALSAPHGVPAAHCTLLTLFCSLALLCRRSFSTSQFIRPSQGEKVALKPH